MSDEETRPQPDCQGEKAAPDLLGDWRRTDMCGELNARDAGRSVTLMGWVWSLRDLGKLLFFEMRDRTGVIQVTLRADEQPELFARVKQWRAEFVVAVRGAVRERSADTINPDMATGAVEIIPDEVKMLNYSDVPPISTSADEEIDERLRLRYRYLDLRSPRMQKNLWVRHRLCQSLRSFLNEEDFWEIETPYLTRSTPEGARDYLVPTRLGPDRFYALPQSPQLFKQLLMLSGYDKYYQLVRCFRDEDLRADRQPEFTQLDIEMSFVGEEEIYSLVERMFQRVFREVIGVEIELPFERMTYEEALDWYGTDKPDLRYAMQLVDLSRQVAESEFRIFSRTVDSGGVVKGFVVPRGADASRSDIDAWEQRAREYGAAGLLWIAWDGNPLSGLDAVRSPISAHLEPSEVREIASACGADAGDLLLLVAGERREVNRVLGLMRVDVADQLNLVSGEDSWEFLWVVQPPLFELEEGSYTSVHHPFTAPLAEDEHKLERDPLSVRSRQYDLVLNGVELASGSIRNHRSDIQQTIFDILDISPQEQQEKFGFLLEAFSYGAPPHGGIAPGLDRIAMLLAGEDTIRDVIAFPKASAGRELMTGAPAEVRAEQLKQLALRVDRDNQ